VIAFFYDSIIALPLSEKSNPVGEQLTDNGQRRGGQSSVGIKQYLMINASMEVLV